MNYIYSSKENIIPYTDVSLEPGIIFKSLEISTTIINDIVFTSAKNSKSYRITVRVVHPDTGLQIEVASKDAYPIGDDTSYTVLVSSWDGGSIYSNGDNKFEVKNKDLTVGDTWYFLSQEDLDITNYLVDCSTINYQTSSAIDQYTYLGNSIDLTLLKSIDEDNLFDPSNDNNVFKNYNYNQVGHLAKIKIETGVKENDNKISLSSFIGFIEDLRESSNTISLFLGDGIYATKQKLAHNIGIVVKRKNLRQLGKTIETLRYTDLKSIEDNQEQIYLPPTEINFETHYRPIVKGYAKQKLEITYEDSFLPKKIELKDYINYIGDRASTNAKLDYDSGLIEFEEAPLSSDNDRIQLTFKHAYHWKHPAFLARKLFEITGHNTSSENFINTKLNSEKLVFSSQGRVLSETQDRSSEIIYSMDYSSINGKYYFAIGDTIVIHDPVTGEDFIVNKELSWKSSWNKDAEHDSCIYKILVSDEVGSNGEQYLIFFSSTESLITKGSRRKADYRRGDRAKIHKLELNADGYPSQDPVLVFETLGSSVDSRQHYKVMGLNRETVFRSFIHIVYDHTLMGTPENKDYSNKAYVNGQYLYFIYQVKMNFTSTAPPENESGDSIHIYSGMKYPKVRNYLVRIDFVNNSFNLNIPFDGNLITKVGTGIISWEQFYLQLDSTTVSNAGIKANDIILITGYPNCNGVWMADSQNESRLVQKDGYEEEFNWGGEFRRRYHQVGTNFYVKFVDIVEGEISKPDNSETFQLINLGQYGFHHIETHDSPYHWSNDTTSGNEGHIEPRETDIREMWGNLPKARCDLFVTEDNQVYTVGVTGDGGAHYAKITKDHIGINGTPTAIGDGNKDGEIIIHNLEFTESDGNHYVVAVEKVKTKFDSIAPTFFNARSPRVEGQALKVGRNHNFSGKEYNHLRDYVPFDIWGLCVCVDGSDTIYSVCTHWKNRVFDVRARYRDFKAIIFHAGDWMHERTHQGLMYLPLDDLDDPKVSTNTGAFMMQRFMFQGTREFKTYGMRSDFLQKKSDGYANNKGHQEELQINPEHIEDKGEDLLTWDSLKYEIRGQGELSMIAKNPVAWTTPEGEKAIIYQGGHFGKYFTTGQIAKKTSNLDDYWWREVGDRSNLLDSDKGEGVLDLATINFLNHGLYRPYHAENSHGRLIEFKLAKNITNIGKTIGWRYLGYPYGESQHDMYKEFSTETVLGENNSLNFVMARSFRSDVSLSSSAFEDDKEHYLSRQYLSAGRYAKNEELDSTFLDNLDNFMWVQYSDKINPKVPIANFNDKYIYDVLSSLALILDCEFGIESDVPFFRRKSTQQYLHKDIGVDEYEIVDPNTTNIGSSQLALSVDNDQLLYLSNSTTTSLSEIVKIENSSMKRGYLNSPKAAKINSYVFKVDAILDPNNTVSVKSYKIDADFIYDEINASFNYYSHSEKKSVTYNIHKKVNYQNTFKKSFDLNIDYIRSTIIAEDIVNRHLSYITIENKILDIETQYMPFLKSGNNVLVKDIDIIEEEQKIFRIISANHDLKNFTTTLKARTLSFSNAYLNSVVST